MCGGRGEEGERGESVWVGWIDVCMSTHLRASSAMLIKSILANGWRVMGKRTKSERQASWGIYDYKMMDARGGLFEGQRVKEKSEGEPGLCMLSISGPILGHPPC